MNAVVATGFVEDTCAFVSLAEYIEGAGGETDEFKFNVLVSILFTIGCLASAGEQQQYDHLKKFMAFSLPEAAM